MNAPSGEGVWRKWLDVFGELVSGSQVSFVDGEIGGNHAPACPCCPGSTEWKMRREEAVERLVHGVGNEGFRSLVSRPSVV